MFTKFNSKQTLQIEDLFKLRCQKISDFSDFVNNVALEYYAPNYQTLQPLRDIINKFPVQWVTPLRNLCMRYINQLSIINNIHVLFVTEAIKRNCLIETLPVINSDAFPYKMEAYDEQYQFSSFIIFFKLGYYAKAFKKIETLVSKRQILHKNAQRYFFAYLLMCRIYQNVYLNEQGLRQALKTNKLSKDTSVQFYNTCEVVLQNLICYAKREKYEEEVMKFLFTKMDKSNIFYDIFELGNQQNGKLRSEVQSFKADRYERIKLSDIKGQNLSNPKTMRQINQLSHLAKYDSKQRILYLNHEKCSQDEINDLISKCYQLNSVIKNSNTIKEHVLGSRFRLGGLGGLGGLSGMSGMGGLGSLMGGRF